MAAGLSTRMGIPKTLIQLDGDTVIGRVVRAALGSGLRRAVIVAGSSTLQTAEAVAALKSSRLSVVVNPRPEKGMSSSLRIGLAALSPDAGGAMILLGDQPLITAKTIDRLLAAFQLDSDKIVVPAIHGRKTTPVIFPARLFPELMTTEGDIGGRDVLKSHPDEIVRVEMGSSYDDTDLDTPDDLEKFTGSAFQDKRLRS
ncbi:MAG: nucleotidyltransferase family protein [Desulfomonile tiedjei]|nr:nucleotidyltransferase family protein [Desulfomonile tiedjei]